MAIVNAVYSGVFGGKPCWLTALAAAELRPALGTDHWTSLLESCRTWQLRTVLDISMQNTSIDLRQFYACAVKKERFNVDGTILYPIIWPVLLC